MFVFGLAMIAAVLIWVFHWPRRGRRRSWSRLRSRLPRPGITARRQPTVVTDFWPPVPARLLAGEDLSGTRWPAAMSRIMTGEATSAAGDRVRGRGAAGEGRDRR